MNDSNNIQQAPIIPNNVMTSLVGSVVLSVAGMAIGWLATHNIIPEAQVGPATAALGAIIIGAIGAGIVWFKGAMATKAAQIKAVNMADNGVKVVAANAPSLTVMAPLK